MIIEYDIIRQRGPRPSKSNPGSRFWEVTLRNNRTQQVYKTYPDTSMENFKFWSEIVESTGNRYTLGNLRISTPGIIDADSAVKILRKNITNFDQLFEMAISK